MTVYFVVTGVVVVAFVVGAVALMRAMSRSKKVQKIAAVVDNPVAAVKAAVDKA